MSWEYKIETYNRMRTMATDIVKDMNSLGREGWDMVTTAIEPTSMVVVYKRQLPINFEVRVDGDKIGKAVTKAVKTTVAAKLGKFTKDIKKG